MNLRDVLAYWRNLIGVLLKDRQRYRRALAGRGKEYLVLCNRNEHLIPAPDGCGFRCDWLWTSDLHAPKYLPRLGVRLLERALAAHPIRRAAAPSGDQARPEATFIIGHRGMERLPHLLATLESIAGQRGADVDCVVVEQDVQPRVAAHLPSWVHHVHTPPPEPGMPYCRSWTFNVGARHAAAPVLVLHDNDMLVSADYAASILARMAQGFEVVNHKRFIFYLSEAHTRLVFDGQAALSSEAPVAIVQNLEAGGSVAVTREAFDKIGGMDESFIGWGGEDNEFWDRAQTLRVWPYAALPIVHLWHAAQPEKQKPGNRTLEHFKALSSVSAADRIERLRSMARGELSGPNNARPCRGAT
jgi:hypothetical protein